MSKPLHWYDTSRMSYKLSERERHINCIIHLWKIPYISSINWCNFYEVCTKCGLSRFTLSS